jgi:hypothetical protein
MSEKKIKDWSNSTLSIRRYLSLSMREKYNIILSITLPWPVLKYV